MTLSKAIPLAALVVAALLLAACGGSGDDTSSGDSGGNGGTPQRGGTLNVAQVVEVETLDPAKALDAASINTLSQIMEPLYWTREDGKVEPWLATGSQLSKDELTWTFDLRKGVEFSDGTPMTADDVVFSLDTAREGANWAPLFEAFESVKATSPSTVQIKVAHPLPAMEALLSSYATVIVPKDYGGVSAKEFGQNPVGTGPFMMGPWQHGTSLTLLPNPHYWEKGKPYLDKVVLKNVPDDTSRASQLKSGELDIAASPPFQQLAGLESDPNLDVGIYAKALSRYILINAASDAFKDPRLREAVYLAVDREGIIDNGFAGKGEVGGAFLSPPIPFHDDSIEAPERDPEKAKQLVAEAAKDGADTSFTLMTEAGNTFAGLASQIIQQNLEEVGFSVKLQPLDSAAVLEELGNGEYEASLGGLYPNVLDPSENTFFYIATEALFTKQDTTRMSKWAEEGSSTADPAAREAAYDKIQEEVDKAHYTITLGYEPYVWVTKSDVTGFGVNPLDISWYADVGFTG